MSAEIQTVTHPQIQYCTTGCCTIMTLQYHHRRTSSTSSTSVRTYTQAEIHRSKAGIFIYDPNEDRILLVQSRGRKWGPAKGSIEPIDEGNQLQCAVREVFEETGISIDVKQIEGQRAIRLDRGHYFYLELDSTKFPASIQDSDENDANGVMWIRSQCLQELIHTQNYKINAHCRKLLHRHLGLTF